MRFEIRTITDRIRLIQSPNQKLAALITDKQLNEDIEYCQFFIDNKDEYAVLEDRITNLMNDITILTTEANKRWWNKIQLSDQINEEDLKYIKRLVELRDIKLSYFQQETGGAWNSEGMINSYDIALKEFKEIKYL